MQLNSDPSLDRSAPTIPSTTADPPVADPPAEERISARSPYLFLAARACLCLLVCPGRPGRPGLLGGAAGGRGLPVANRQLATPS